MLLATANVGCGDETGAARVTFSARAGGIERDATQPMRFTTDTGWTVTLTTARMAVGPLYLNTLEALQADRRSPLRRAAEGLFMGTAWAHGADHLGAGQVIGQVTTQIEVDLLAPTPVELPGGGAGIDAPARTAEAWLYNRDGELGGAAVRVQGVAEREGVSLRFAGALVIDASLATEVTPLEAARRVRGIPVNFTLAQGGALTVRIDPRGWFTHADFSELASATVDPEAVREFSLRDNVGRAFADNVRASRAVYAFTFSAR